MSVDRGPLISALGMVSSVGLDAASSCAALRAGITRSYPLPGLVGSDDEPLMVARVGHLTEGFVQTGAWIRMVLASLADLERALDVSDRETFWRETSVLWVLPELSYERFGWPETEVEPLLASWLCEKTAVLSRLPLQTALNGLIQVGSVGAALALARARDDIAQRRATRVLVVGVDSWLDAMSLQRLIEENRIRSRDQPHGLAPGEAAACVLLEEPETALRRGAVAQATVLASAAFRVPIPVDEEDPARWRVEQAPAIGRTLAEAIRAVLQVAESGGRFGGDVVLDLNGEPWKALVWAHAQLQLTDMVDPEALNLVLPCLSFGETGAPSGLLGLCVAARSFARAYATGDQGLVCSVSDRGDVAAILVARP